MKYRKFIEDWFLIDEPGTGELVPFKFNKVQAKYYKIMCDEYDIEKRGISVAVRDIVLKARREGMSSLVLALFAADDILNKNPTESQVISYKQEMTKKFMRRYRTYVLSYFERRWKVTDPREVFTVDEKSEVIHKDNGAHFYCGTASARTGERGGVLQKLLFSEAAFYPDSEVMTAEEIIDGTMRQVDIANGWVFMESTANGKGNPFHNIWEMATLGESRFKPRFFGWREFYTEKEFKTICTEFADKKMIPQEYPETPEEAFLASVSNFTTSEDLKKLFDKEYSTKKIIDWLELQGTNFIEQCEIIKNHLIGLEQNNPQRDLYVGIDVAKYPDSTVVTTLQDKTTLSRGGIKAIAIDSTGTGDYMPDWFERNGRWYLMPIKFSATQKDALYKNLLQIINNQFTEIPKIETDEYNKFIKQMIDLQAERKNNLLICGHPEGKNYHDDYPDSWALAEWGYMFINGVPQSQKAQMAKDEPPIKTRLNRMLDVEKARKRQSVIANEYE